MKEETFLIIHRLEGFGQKEYNLDEDNGMIQMMDTTTVDIDIAVLEIANMSRTTMEERQQFLQGKTHPPGHGLQFHQLLQSLCRTRRKKMRTCDLVMKGVSMQYMYMHLIA
jgi:hypothetical protein